MSAQKHEVDRQLDDRRIELEFVKAYGSANQYERWTAGLLPEAELLSLARWEIFAAFADFPRWVKLEPGDMRHERSCNGGEVRFVTDKPGSLTHDEWAIFKKITQRVHDANMPAGQLTRYGVHGSVELVEHIGRCSSCTAEVFGRSASIRVTWAGRPLSREYTLEGQP